MHCVPDAAPSELPSEAEGNDMLQLEIAVAAGMAVTGGLRFARGLTAAVANQRSLNNFSAFVRPILTRSASLMLAWSNQIAA